MKNKGHVKISTIVQPDDLEGFFTRYADVCKASMLSLRKRDRRKRKADKGKKKKGTLGVGNGAVFFASESDKVYVIALFAMRCYLL